MASSLYTLNLDFSKELNYTKAIMGRQGDKGLTITINAFLNGLPLVPDTGAQFYMKGTTPSGRYVDAATTSVKGNVVSFNLDGRFMSEQGYYPRVYFEYTSGDTVLTSQDIIFFTNAVSDISQGQADEYLSRLEKLIQEYNDTFDKFMAEIEKDVETVQVKIDDLNDQALALKNELDDIKTSIANLTIQKYKLTKDNGTGYRLSDYPDPKPTSFLTLAKARYGYVTLTTAEAQAFTDYNNLPTLMKGKDLQIMVEPDFSGIAKMTIKNSGDMAWVHVGASSLGAWQQVANMNWTVITINAAKTEVNKYTDDKVKPVADNLATLTTTVGDNTTNITANKTAIDNMKSLMPLSVHYGQGSDIPDAPVGTKALFGNLIATDFFHTTADVPYTMSSDKTTLTFTRDCAILFDGTFKLHTNSTQKWIYVKIRKNGGDFNFAAVGSSQNFNYMNTVSGHYIHQFAKGDTLYFTCEAADGTKLFRFQMLGMSLTEVKKV